MLYTEIKTHLVHQTYRLRGLYTNYQETPIILVLLNVPITDKFLLKKVLAIGMHIHTVEPLLKDTPDIRTPLY